MSSTFTAPSSRISEPRADIKEGADMDDRRNCKCSCGKARHAGVCELH
jgi:hypothetical protein